MKKIFSMFMIGTMCSVGFTGCGDKKKEEVKKTATTETTTPDGKTTTDTKEMKDTKETKTP